MELDFAGEAPVVVRLGELEGVIERGLGTFVEVGNALLEIRDSRLYRESFSTFEDYCRERWGFSYSHAHRLMQSAEVATRISPIGEIANEGQARALAAYPEDEQATIYREAVQEAEEAGISLTARRIVETGERLVKDLTDRLGVHYSSASAEWNTPPQVITATLAALGGIDVDPCTNPTSAVPATTRYTEQDDGLTQSWVGRVYMNPPYGSEIGAWVDKLLEEYQAHRTSAAIALVPARVDTAWFTRLSTHPICFVRGRLKFGDSPNAAPFPSAAVYLGPNLNAFAVAFAELGSTYVRFEPH